MVSFRSDLELVDRGRRRGGGGGEVAGPQPVAGVERAALAERGRRVDRQGGVDPPHRARPRGIHRHAGGSVLQA